MMMRKLRLKLMGVVTIALVIVLAAVLGLLNVMNYREIREDIDDTLRLIVASGGTLEADLPDGNHAVDYVFTQETPFQMRYCSILLSSATLRPVNVNMSHIVALSEERAVEYAQSIVQRGQRRGFFTTHRITYAFLNVEQQPNNMVVLLDCTMQMTSARNVTQRSILLGLTCLLVFVIVVYALSRRIMRPVIANMESQKQFITNAGHELKTPLAIISANTEFLEMTTGENEWTLSIRKQVDRLTVLVNKLIRLAKMSERNKPELMDIDCSHTVSEAVNAFAPLAEQMQKKLTYSIKPHVHALATADGLPELINILLDNAVKYCDEQGEIHVSLFNRKGEKGAVLRVSNTYKDGAKLDYGRFFDRFYRQDTSHSSEKAGYGIGLSMAQGLADEFHGKISVEYRQERIVFSVTLP